MHTERVETNGRKKLLRANSMIKGLNCVIGTPCGILSHRQFYLPRLVIHVLLVVLKTLKNYIFKNSKTTFASRNNISVILQVFSLFATFLYETFKQSVLSDMRNTLLVLEQGYFLLAHTYIYTYIFIV